MFAYLEDCAAGALALREHRPREGQAEHGHGHHEVAHVRVWKQHGRWTNKKHAQNKAADETKSRVLKVES